jgi:small subunit ribosomal protein S17
MADENVEQNETEGTGAEAEPVTEAEPVEAEAEPVAEAAEEPVAEAEAEPVAEAAAEPAADEEAEHGADDAEEPAADAEPEREAAPVEVVAEAAAPARRKKKRLPRALRPQRTRPTRERSTERKPITRLPKPEHARGRRQERQGAVVSAAGDKTIVVRVDTVKAHPMYKKVIRRSTKLHAHDERNEAKVGDIVRVVETRPVSKLKRWRLQEIVEAAK